MDMGFSWFAFIKLKIQPKICKLISKPLPLWKFNPRCTIWLLCLPRRWHMDFTATPLSGCRGIFCSQPNNWKWSVSWSSPCHCGLHRRLLFVETWFLWFNFRLCSVVLPWNGNASEEQLRFLRRLESVTSKVWRHCEWALCHMLH